ncbi:MAG: lysozyme inhibitor LprI family protein [Pyrinomonadaceae bacterium]
MRACFVLLFLLIPSMAPAQGTKIHPIEKVLDACIEKDPSTAGMVRCTDQAYYSWDKELNKNYAALARRLNAEGKQTLKAAQLAWLKYRDAEFKLVDSVYSRMQGTMYIPMHIARKKETVKQRAQDLADHLELIQESEPSRGIGVG